MPNPPDCEVSTFFISLPTTVSYAQIPTINGSFSSAFTVALWVDIEALAPGQNSLVTVTAGGQSYNLLSVYGSYYGGPTLIASWGNGSVNTDFTMDTWTYLVVTWDGTNLTLYVDGDEIGSVQPTTTSSVTNPAFTLGANATMPPRSGSAGLFGGVRNFAYWSQVLTAAQIPTQMWTNSATVSTNLQSFLDFTQSPVNVLAGPTPTLTNALLEMKSYGLLSDGTDVATPGPASSLAPSAAAPFSVIAWVVSGDSEELGAAATASSALLRRPFAASTSSGCIFASGDATDAGNMALSLVAGVPTVTFGTGSSMQTVSASGTTLSDYTWNAIAVTYDGTTCTIYVNGTSAGSATINSTVAPTTPVALMGQNDDDTPSNFFGGMLQYLSVWNVALTASDVLTWLDNDPSSQTSCVADFDCATNPPQDLVPLEDNAIWGDNQITLGSGMTWVGTLGIAAGSSIDLAAKAAEPTPPAPRELPPIRRVRFGKTRRRRTRNVEPFGKEHRRRMRSDLLRALGSIPSASTRQRTLAAFEKKLAEVFDAAAAGANFFPEACRISRDGERLVMSFGADSGTPWVVYVAEEKLQGDKPEYLVTFTSASGEVLARIQTDITAACLAWWVTFVFTLFSGTLTILGLPTPTQRLQQIATDIASNPQVMAVLTTVPGATITASTVVGLLGVLYDYGYLMQVISAAASALGWWGVTRLTARIILYFSPVPNPSQAAFIAACIVLVAQLVKAILGYNTACGS